MAKGEMIAVRCVRLQGGSNGQEHFVAQKGMITHQEQIRICEVGKGAAVSGLRLPRRLGSRWLLAICTDCVALLLLKQAHPIVLAVGLRLRNNGLQKVFT